MNDLKDRRYMDRIHIPMAKMYYRQSEKNKLLNTFQGPVPIADMSKSSLSIDAPLKFKLKTHLYLKILIPDHPVIFLKGQIAGHLSNAAGEIIRTIIQILPYGLDPCYNSFKFKKRLEHCLADHTPV